jgi:hypothetical protein
VDLTFVLFPLLREHREPALAVLSAELTFGTMRLLCYRLVQPANFWLMASQLVLNFHELSNENCVCCLVLLAHYWRTGTNGRCGISAVCGHVIIHDTWSPFRDENRSKSGFLKEPKGGNEKY